MTEMAISWLQSFVLTVGEPQPNKNFVHLPTYLNKHSLYKDCVEELQIHNPDFNLSLSQFYSIWKLHFGNVKIPAQTRLGRCDECSSIKTKLAGATTATKEMFVKQKRDHIGLASIERIALMNRKLVAQTNPLQHHHLIIDGMTTIYMPNIQPIPSKSSKEPRFRFHVTGIIDHTYNKRFMYFVPTTLEGIVE